MREERNTNNDLISREALKKAIKDEFDLAIHNGDIMLMSKSGIVYRILSYIDNAPTVSQVTVFCENADEKTVEDLKNELTQDLINKITVNAGLAQPIKEEIPQNDIRWTDKVSVTSSGDIIDFEGRVVGHINLEDIKGGAE